MAKRFSWEAAIEHLMSQGAADREQAQTVMLLAFMERGELRPLAEFITDGEVPDRAVLDYLASMIFKRTLVAKRQRGRGRPRLPGKSARDIARALSYAEEKVRSGHTAAVQKTADKFRVSEKTVLRAITHWHRMDNKS
jgi:hypothetical protein